MTDVDLARIEQTAIDVYQTVSEGVTPYLAQVGKRVITFGRRPNAKTQLDVMKVFAGKSEKEMEETGITPETMEIVLTALRSMLSDPADVDYLLEQLDLEPLSDLLGVAMEKVTARPTTGSSDSLGTPSPTTSDTGSSDPVSPNGSSST